MTIVYKSIKMLSLYFHELIMRGKIEEHEGNLMTDDYMLDKMLDKIEMIIGIEKLRMPRY